MLSSSLVHWKLQAIPCDDDEGTGTTTSPQTHHHELLRSEAGTQRPDIPLVVLPPSPSELHKGTSNKNDDNDDNDNSHTVVLGRNSTTLIADPRIFRKHVILRMILRTKPHELSSSSSCVGWLLHIQVRQPTLLRGQLYQPPYETTWDLNQAEGWTLALLCNSSTSTSSSTSTTTTLQYPYRIVKQNGSATVATTNNVHTPNDNGGCSLYHCPLCLDIYVHPIVCLPCGHSFCQSCCGTENYSTTTSNNNNNLAQQPQSLSLCALCRQPVQLSGPNRLVQQLVEQYVGVTTLGQQPAQENENTSYTLQDDLQVYHERKRKLASLNHHDNDGNNNNNIIVIE